MAWRGVPSSRGYFSTWGTIIWGVLLYAQLWYSESKSGASKSKSKRTTRRENFIPILDIVELSAVANAVIEAIQLFRDPSRKEEQKAWLAVGQKRKRGA